MGGGEGGWGHNVSIDHKCKFKLLLIILMKDCDVKGEGVRELMSW